VCVLFLCVCCMRVLDKEGRMFITHSATRTRFVLTNSVWLLGEKDFFCRGKSTKESLANKGASGCGCGMSASKFVALRRQWPRFDGGCVRAPPQLRGALPLYPTVPTGLHLCCTTPSAFRSRACSYFPGSYNAHTSAAAHSACICPALHECVSHAWRHY
jgi:hypothetical protein